MIASAAKLPVLIALVLVLGFNLTQRKHVSHGENKRFATLRIAGLILLLYAAVLVIEEFALTDILIGAVLFVIAVFLRVYRKKIFLFSTRCAQCGTRYPLRQILYYDNPSCDVCEPQANAVPDSVPESQRTVHDVSDIDWDTYPFTDHAVLCYIRVDGNVLLIEKKTGLGAGKVNAAGGRIEEGETPIEAAAREVEEEIVVTAENLVLSAEVSFVFTSGYSLAVKVFLSDTIHGEPTETREAKPFWVAEEDIPYDRMWEDDIVWLPQMLAGEFVRGRFIFDGDSMISHEVTVGT